METKSQSYQLKKFFLILSPDKLRLIHFTASVCRDKSLYEPCDGRRT